MVRRIPLLLTLAGLVLAAAAAWAAHGWIRSQGELAARKQVVFKPVVTAARDLPAGHAISVRDLRVTPWPQTGLPAGYFSSPAALKGRAPLTRLFKGEVVLAGKLAAKGLSGGLSSMVPKGMRAMTVKVDEVIGVGGFVQPGDRVDVLVTMDSGPFRDDPVTRTVLKGVRVLTVGEKVERKTGKGTRPKRRKVSVVTLQLTPAQGETLALAAATGKVLLSLRNQADDKLPSTAGVRLTSLAAEAAGTPASSKKDASSPTIEVIRGVRRSLQSMEPEGGSAPEGRRAEATQACWRN